MASCYFQPQQIEMLHRFQIRSLFSFSIFYNFRYVLSELYSMCCDERKKMDILVFHIFHWHCVDCRFGCHNFDRVQYAV